MIKYLVSVLFLSVFISKADVVSPERLRQKLYAAVESGSVAKAFLAELENYPSDADPIIEGYKAAVNMVMAKHAFNPYKKYKYFLSGRNQLEQVIKNAPENIELRLIRYSIQINIPSFLGYNNDIINDKKFLVKNLSKLTNLTEDDRRLKKYIVEVLKLKQG